MLKGAATLTAAPGGEVVVNPTGTPLLSTAGAGDVLAGAIGAFLAGGIAPGKAAAAAAFLQRARGRGLTEALGDAGLLAGELATALPRGPARRVSKKSRCGCAKRSSPRAKGHGEIRCELASDSRPVTWSTSESLGAGKTALARGVARGLRALPRQVASPTFAILHEYADGGGAIVLRHLDLYRLEDRQTELAILGLPGSTEGAPVVVEWPGSAIRELLPPTLELELKVLPDGKREIRVLSPSPEGRGEVFTSKSKHQAE